MLTQFVVSRRYIYLILFTVSFQLLTGCSKSNDILTADLRSDEKKSAKEELIEAYISDLGHTNRVTRIEAVGKLRALKHDAVPKLLDAAKNEKGSLRTRAIYILGEVATLENSSELESILNNKKNPLDSKSKAMLFGAMAKVGGDRYKDLFKKEILKPSDEDVQCALAFALLEWGDRSGTAHFLRLLDKRTGQKRIWPSKCLERLYGKDIGTDPENWRIWFKENNIKVLLLPECLDSRRK